MPRSFSLPTGLKIPGLKVRDPRVAARIVLGVLLVANLAAAVVVFRPFGGSAEDLERQQQQLRQQLDQAQKHLEQSQKLVTKVDQARQEGDQFLAKYVTDRRVTMSTVDEELVRISKEAGVTPKG